MKNRYHFFIPVLLSVMISSCGMSDLTLSSYDGSRTVTLKVEVADTPKERAQGLMHRESLEEGTGMLFVLPKPQMLSFWMKDTKIPLEILFFDPSGSFVNAYTMQPCTIAPCESYPSEALSTYALEVNPGFREENAIGVGWKLDLTQIETLSDPS
jgi:uncharacterized membrane protein (UPF0127 family)